MVGGGAYAVGKRSAQRSAQQAQEEADQDARISDLESQQHDAGHQSGQNDEPSVSDQLRQLADLHKQGALSDAEFASAKAKLLGG